MKILVVDDERPARERLERLVEGAGHQVCGTAASGREALAACQQFDPDAVLMDIEMPGMDGLEAARHLAKLASPPAVIFCTAYDAYALEAFDAEALDYLLKPVRAERLDQALQRVSGRRGALPDSASRAHLCARMGTRLELIAVDEISVLKAEQKYVVVMHDGGEALLDESLTALESEFPEHFARVHRNALVAVGRIKALTRAADGSTALSVQGVDEPITVSRRNLPAVRALVKSL